MYKQIQFKNRKEAGERLAKILAVRSFDDAIIYSLPRGGVVIGYEIAKALNSPLELVITRKIAHPYSNEFAICAINEYGDLLCNEEELSVIPEQWVKDRSEVEMDEIIRRKRVYFGNRERLKATGMTAIVVDDGVATGLTIRSAIDAIKKEQPKKIILAVPILPAVVAQMLRREVDELVAIHEPNVFRGAIGSYYDDFSQLNDDDVIRYLNLKRN